MRSLAQHLQRDLLLVGRGSSNIVQPSYDYLDVGAYMFATIEITLEACSFAGITRSITVDVETNVVDADINETPWWGNISWRKVCGITYTAAEIPPVYLPIRQVTYASCLGGESAFMKYLRWRVFVADYYAWEAQFKINVLLRG